MVVGKTAWDAKIERCAFLEQIFWGVTKALVPERCNVGGERCAAVDDLGIEQVHASV